MNPIYVVLTAVLLLGNPFSKPESTDLANCRSWQEGHAISDKLQAMGPPPTRMRIMGARYCLLVKTEAGFQKTHILGVGLESGQFTSNGIDDIGLYLIVPWLAYRLGLGVAPAYDVFILTVLALSFISGVIGFLWLTPGKWPRAVAIGAIAVTSLLEMHVSDVYIVLGAVPVALVPWILLAVRRRSWPLFLMVGGLVGGVAALANLVRSYSGTFMLVFLILAWALSRSVPSKIRLAGLGTAVLCFTVVWTAFHHVIAQRNTFLRVYAPSAPLTQSHPFWHPIYVGLGYVKNDAVPGWKDEDAIAKVCSIDPAVAYLSPEYEKVLRTATVQLVRTRPGVVIRNVVTKTSIVIMYTLVLGNIGWLALFRRPLVWAIDLAFFASMALNSLYGILVIPYYGYLFGLIAYAALFGATSFMLAMESKSSPGSNRPTSTLPG